MSNYAKLCEFYRKIKNLSNIASIMNWDTATIMPPSAAAGRGEELSLLESMKHEALTSNQLGDLIAAVDLNQLDKWQLANVREIKKHRDNSLAVEKRLLERSVLASTECEMIWREARKKNDFKMLLPYLEKVVSITQEIAKSRADYFSCTPYDALLDIYDPGRKLETVEKIFSDLKGFLPTFIQKVSEKQKSIKVHSFSNQIFEEEKQKALGVYCMNVLGFNFTRGRLDTSTHPFCGGHPGDLRITTRYDNHNFLIGLMGILHETGHALYEQNLPEEYQRQSVGEAKSMAVHESQSLFVELQISRSREFLEFIQPKILETLGVTGNEYSVDNLYNTLNRVHPSLIRVDADEVTYPAHILLRFELEKEIIKGNLLIKDLPQSWNKGMKQLVGIEPDSDANGCMQDIHWPAGAFGYFPTYLLGAILAAQLFAAIKKDNSNIQAQIKAGNFSVFTDWLKKNIHSQGALYSTRELVTHATGNDINPADYKQYLEAKYLN